MRVIQEHFFCPDNLITNTKTGLHRAQCFGRLVIALQENQFICSKSERRHCLRTCYPLLEGGRFWGDIHGLLSIFARIYSIP
jgi:hypothetical protein